MTKLWKRFSQKNMKLRKLLNLTQTACRWKARFCQKKNKMMSNSKCHLSNKPQREGRVSGKYREMKKQLEPNQ